MISKLFEIRDRHTFIPVLATQLCTTGEAERYLLARGGYSSLPFEQARYVIVARIDGGSGVARCNPYDWDDSSRTMQVAHEHIIAQFDFLETGAVVDVEFLLDETAQPKIAQRLDKTSPFNTGDTHGI